MNLIQTRIDILRFCMFYLLFFSYCTQALAQEIGDNVNIQSVLNNSGNWRGRSQQILQLQQKV